MAKKTGIAALARTRGRARGYSTGGLAEGVDQGQLDQMADVRAEVMERSTGMDPMNEAPDGRGGAEYSGPVHLSEAARRNAIDVGLPPGLVDRLNNAYRSGGGRNYQDAMRASGIYDTVNEANRVSSSPTFMERVGNALGVQRGVIYDPSTETLGYGATGLNLNLPGIAAGLVAGPVAGIAVGAGARRAGVGNVSVPFGEVDQFGNMVRGAGSQTPSTDGSGGGDRADGTVPVVPTAETATKATTPELLPDAPASLFDEGSFLKRHGDVADAVSRGVWRSGRDFDTAWRSYTGRGYDEATPEQRREYGPRLLSMGQGYARGGIAELRFAGGGSVDDTFMQTLGRAPEQWERDAWAAVGLTSGGDQLRDSLMQTDEFEARSLQGREFMPAWESGFAALNNPFVSSITDVPGASYMTPESQPEIAAIPGMREAMQPSYALNAAIGRGVTRPGGGLSPPPPPAVGGGTGGPPNQTAPGAGGSIGGATNIGAVTPGQALARPDYLNTAIGVHMPTATPSMPVSTGSRPNTGTYDAPRGDALGGAYAASRSPVTAGDTMQVQAKQIRGPSNLTALYDYLRGLGVNVGSSSELPWLANRYGADRFALPDQQYARQMADGGRVDMRAGGGVDGPGTETSDSIPARLSDGEFVLTARAVRGMGDGDREVGARRLYALMDRLEGKATPR
jgi:hypothetical protein